MGDGEGLIVADVLAARLLGVAHKVGLLIPPYKLSGCAKNKDPEDKKHSEPDSANDSGVLIHLFQDVPQETPVAHFSPTWRRERQKLRGCSAIPSQSLLTLGLPLLFEFLEQ